MTACVLLALVAAACGTGGGRRVDVQALIRNDTTTTSAAALGGTDAFSAKTGGFDASGHPLPGSTSATTSAPGSTHHTTATARTSTAPIRIGLHLSANLQAAYTALGASGAEGDLTAPVTAVVDYINAHGGMAGRKVQPIFHESDPLKGSFDAEGQATCDDFASDQHVFAVVSGAVLPTLVLPDCLAKKHVPLVWNYQILIDEPLWRQWRPYLYQPFSVNADRMGFYVDQLVANHFFETGARVAIIRYDLDQHARFAKNVLRPRLSANHINVVDEVALSRPDSAGAAADVGAQIGSAILRLRAENVSHIVFVPTGGAVPFLFMSQAQGAGFRPRYAMNSLDIPYFVADQAPAGQLSRSLAIGWSPQSDVHRADEPPPNALTALCYKITNSPGAMRYCDGLFFLKAALDRAGRVDAASLQASVESMGSTFEPSFSLADTFAPGRHDGASAVRLDAFDDGCACFKYAGPITPIG